MEVLLVSLLNGLVYGMLLFMLASGLTLIFSMMGVLNFAHASAYMLGAYFAYTISLYIGFWPALIMAPLLCGLVGAAIEMWGLRRLHAADLGLDVRRDLARPDPHPHRAGDPGGADPSRHGVRARP